MPGGRNPFQLKAVLRDIDAQGIKVGDLVTVTWDYTREGDDHAGSHTGILRELDRSTGRFELNPSGSSPGHLKASLMVSSIRATQATLSPAEFQPFKRESGTTDSKTPTENPFVAKARKAAMSKKPRERTVKEHALFQPKKPNPFIDKAGKS